MEAVEAVRGGGVGGEGGGGGACGRRGFGHALEACKNFLVGGGGGLGTHWRPVRTFSTAVSGGSKAVRGGGAEGVWARTGGLRTFYVQQ